MYGEILRIQQELFQAYYFWINDRTRVFLADIKPTFLNVLKYITFYSNMLELCQSGKGQKYKIVIEKCLKQG